MIVCRICNEEKDESSFYLRKETGKYRSECKQCHGIRASAWQNKNRNKVRGYVRKSCKKAYDANPEKYKEKSRNKRMANPERAREIVNKSFKKKYYSMHTTERARLNQLNASRRSATPKWLSAIHRAQIMEFYDLARAKTMQTGVMYHVDHIIPVNGKNVSGLHVPWNLQLLTQAENCAKKNSVWEI